MLYVCYSQTGKFCYSQCFEDVVPCFITGIQSERINVFVHMKVLSFGLIWNMFWTCFFFLFLYGECSVFWVKRFLLWALCCLCCSAKACRNVLLTDASSYLPRAVVGFKPRGRRMCDLLKHMLLVLSPSTMTETRTVSMRSSLMAGKVEGHIWARMDFPQLYTGVCTSIWQITTPMLN